MILIARLVRPACHLGAYSIGEVEEDSLDRAVGCVVGSGGGDDLGVLLEEQVDFLQELVHVDRGEELGELASDLPDTLGGGGREGGRK